MIKEKMNSMVKELSESGVVISFNGSFTQNIIEDIGEAIKKYIEKDMSGQEDNESISYNVFSIYIEQSQNIKNYIQKKLECESNLEFFKAAFESIIVIGKEECGYYVCSGNVLSNEDRSMLKDSIDHINSLDKAELKKLYKEKLRSENCDGMGAGLGLIEMARRSSGKLEYMFIERDEKYSFFTLKAIVS